MFAAFKRPVAMVTALRLCLGTALALTVWWAQAAPSALLEERMQRFRDGSLRGFSLSELPDDGREIYAEADFQALAATGANVVRVAIQLRKCKGCDHYDLPEADIRYVQRVLARGERHDLRVVLVLLATPWGNQSDYWDSDSLKADIVKKWGLVAGRLKAHAALQAYDLINEPVVPGTHTAAHAQAKWHELASAIAQELRRVDPDTPLMIEPTPWGLPDTFKDMPLLDLPGVVYSFHFYAPHEFTHQGLPGHSDSFSYPGQGWDSSRLSLAMDEARRFARQHQVPMFVGEFSCVRWAPAGSCPRYLSDALVLFQAEQWGWAYHCWRCYQGWDAEVPQHVAKDQRAGHLPEHRRSDSPTLLLLKQAMQAKRGTDREGDRAK